jgi:hypothetical protein
MEVVKPVVQFYQKNESMILYIVIMVLVIFIAVWLKRKCVDKFKSISKIHYKTLKQRE